MADPGAPPWRARLAAREPTLRALFAVLIGFGFTIAGGALRARNFPLDDTYIHLSYGLDFRPSTLFSFQGGVRDTGTSSWLWTLIAIAVVQLHLPEYPVLTVLGMSFFSATLWLVMGLVRRALPAEVPLRSLWPYAAALLVAASGNVIWLSITGMETALAILLLVALVPRLLGPEGMSTRSGLLALALIWTRIEGVAWLALAAAIAPLTGERGARRERRGWILPLGGVALYCAYNLAVGGHLLPTTALSKRATFVPGGHAWKAEWEFVASLTRNYLMPWAPGFCVQFVTLAITTVVLVALAGRPRLRALPRLDPARAAVAVLLGGAFAHGLVNVVEFRTAYHHMRYFAPVMALLPALILPVLLAGIDGLSRWAMPRLRSPRARAVASRLSLAIGIPVFLGALIADLRRAPAWAAIYLHNAEQLADVHLAVGRWLRADAPKGTRQVASFDIGALRWGSRLDIVDLAGTKDAQALGFRQVHKQALLVKETRPELYIGIENGFDYLPASSAIFDLELLRTWASPEYFDPYPPHSKRMVVYRINHCDAPRLVRVNVGVQLNFDFAPGDAKAKARAGRGDGDAFALWPVTAKELGHNVYQARGRFLATDAGPLRDRATGRFETPPMRVEGDFLSFRIAGGHDPARLRVELRSEGRVLESWTGYDNDVFLEIVRPLDDLRRRTFSIAVIDESTERWGHLLVDDVVQFVWRELPAKPCPKP